MGRKASGTKTADRPKNDLCVPSLAEFTMKCPICDKNFSEDAPGAALPFCSVRCKMIDCKRWLGEEYSFQKVNDEAVEKEILYWEESTLVPPEQN